MSKRAKNSILLIFLFSFTTLASYGQWERLDQPEGANIHHITDLGSSLFITTSGGSVFRSDDNAESWSEISNGLPIGGQSRFMKKVNGVLYVQTGFTGNGLYRSADNGLTWTQCNINLISHNLRGMTSNGSKLYLASRDGIFFSTDNGINWTYKPLDVGGYGIQSLLFYDGKLIMGSWVLSVSEDDGDTWKK